MTVSRRRFLGTASAALLTSNSLLRPAHAARLAPRRRPPSDRIAIAVIGCGKMANDYHLPQLLAQPDVQIVAVCEVDTTRREHARKRVEQSYSDAKRDFRGCQAVVDFREVLADPDIDAVCIATPDHWHATPLVEACKAGKDVYCEKPLTLTLAEAERCVAAARKYNRVVQTGSQQRSNVFGPFCEAVEILRSGRLGRIHRVTVGVGKPSVPCDLPEEDPEPGLEWDLWLGQAPLRPYHSILSPRGVQNHFPAWRDYREYSGGGHTDMGAHHYDIVQWALGRDASGPCEIIPPDDRSAVSGVRFLYDDGIEVEHGGPGGCVFFGERGELHIDRGHLSSQPEEIVKTPLGEGDVRIERSPGHHRNWLDCLLSRQRPVADVEIGARTVAFPLLGNLAYWYGQRLKWDPQRWRFADESHNAWLDRPRREPWPLPSLD